MQPGSDFDAINEAAKMCHRQNLSKHPTNYLAAIVAILMFATAPYTECVLECVGVVASAKENNGFIAKLAAARFPIAND